MVCESPRLATGVPGLITTPGFAPAASMRSRCRRQLKCVVRNASAIDVEAHAGRVTLRGPVLAAERDALLREAAGLKGEAKVAQPA